MSGVLFLVGAAAIGAVLVFAVAFAIVGDAKPLSQVIKETAHKTVADYFASDDFNLLVRRIYFEVLVAKILRRADPRMSDRAADQKASGILKEFLTDTGIEFGDPSYDWTLDGAVILAREYEIDHWEAVTP